MPKRTCCERESKADEKAVCGDKRCDEHGNHYEFGQQSNFLERRSGQTGSHLLRAKVEAALLFGEEFLRVRYRPLPGHAS